MSAPKPAPQKPPKRTPAKHLIKGRESEDLVLKVYLKRGWKLFLRNKKQFGIEIDLLLVRGNEFLAIEVKSIQTPEQISWRLSYRQNQRLHNFASYWHQRHSTPQRTLEIRVAFVLPSDEILEIPLPPVT